MALQTGAELDAEQQIRTQEAGQETPQDLFWELWTLCKEYLEEKNKDWQKRKLQREQKNNRILRLEKA